MIGPKKILEQRQREIDEALTELEPRIDAYLEEYFTGGVVQFDLEIDEELSLQVVHALREKYLGGDDPWGDFEYQRPTGQKRGLIFFDPVKPESC